MKADEVKPIYVLYGPDAYVRDLHRRTIVTRAVGEGDPQVAVASLDATAGLAQVLDELRTLPFLAPRRVVVIRDADAFVTAHRGGLEHYLESPSPHGTLLLLVRSWRKNTRLHKRVQQVGELIACDRPQGAELLHWLTDAAARQGKQLAADAAEMLAQWVGVDLSALSAELEKLAAYVGDHDAITVEDVSAIVAATAGAGPFELADAISAADAPRALHLLDSALATRGDEFKTLGLLAWHLRRAVRAQHLMQSGESSDRACAAVRVFYRQKQGFLDMLRRRPLAKLHGDVRELIRADLAMKSGTNPRAAMRDLVLRLCN
jgi:DNA polymerase-3 subunit delta